MKCPKCHLENPDNALICDCGYNFATKEKEPIVHSTPNKINNKNNRKCRNCGKDLSLWTKIFSADRTLCPECKAIKKDKIGQYISKINVFGADSYLSPQEEKELIVLKDDLGLTEEDLKEADRIIANLRLSTKNTDIAKYEEKLREVGEDGYLSSQEELELGTLKQRLNLSESNINNTYGQLLHLKRLTSIKDGNLPVLNADILMKKGEQCHYEISSELIEEKTRTRYVGGTQGVSFRIMKGVSYRVGGFKGERVVDTFQKVTDVGTLYITNKKIVFVGARKNVTYPLNKIVNFIKYEDAIKFQKENELKPKYFVINDKFAIDEIGLIITTLFNSL